MSMYEILEETKQITTTAGNSCDCIVLLVDSLSLETQKSYDLKLMGESMYNWVVRACPTKPTLIKLNQDDELLSTIKPMLKDSEYTLVLYSDTPLITASGVNQIIDFAVAKNLSVCKLNRGWVFKTDYIKNASTIYALNTYDVCNNEQFKVDSVDSLIKATNILQMRINKYHIAAGVNISNPQNTYIECSVAIEPGATIEAYAKLEGSTTIGANSKVCSFATISDSKIDERAIIKGGSVIVRSAVLDNAIVGNNCVVTNKSVVGQETIVSSGGILDQTTTNNGCKVGAGSTLINTKLANNVNMGLCCNSFGTETADVKVGSGANIGNGCALFGGVYIKSDYNLADGKVAKRD